MVTKLVGTSHRKWRMDRDGAYIDMKCLFKSVQKSHERCGAEGKEGQFLGDRLNSTDRSLYNTPLPVKYPKNDIEGRWAKKRTL